MSDQQRQALLINHKNRIGPLILAKERATGALSKAFELAKKEGIPKKDIELALKFEREPDKEGVGGVDKVKNDLERIHRIGRWLGFTDQLDLFGEKETNAQRYYEDGRRAALNDRPASPPGHLSHRDAQTWLGGHAAGRLTLNAERARGFSPLSDAAKQIAEKAGVAASLDQPVNPQQTWLGGTPPVEPGGEDTFVQ
jgi:hypothetical protein